MKLDEINVGNDQGVYAFIDWGIVPLQIMVKSLDEIVENLPDNELNVLVGMIKNHVDEMAECFGRTFK